MDLIALQSQIIEYDANNNYKLEIYDNDGIDENYLQTYINVVNCFHVHHLESEYSVSQILNKFVARYDSKEDFVRNYLLDRGIESKLQEIVIPTLIGEIPIYLDCLDFAEIWNTISQLETILKGYVYVEDTLFYLYDMTR